LTTNIQISPAEHCLAVKQNMSTEENRQFEFETSFNVQQIKPNIIQITISIWQHFRVTVRVITSEGNYSPHSSFNMLKSVNFSTTHSRVVFLIV